MGVGWAMRRIWYGDGVLWLLVMGEGLVDWGCSVDGRAEAIR